MSKPSSGSKRSVAAHYDEFVPEVYAMDKRTNNSVSDDSHSILGVKVAITSLEGATDYVIGLSHARKGSYVCAANVHMCMETYRDKSFQLVVNNAALVVPDGKPLMWWMRSFGAADARQVRGPDLFISVCRKASQCGIPIALYGASQCTLERLQAFLLHDCPDLRIACAISPPFKPITKTEQRGFLEQIRTSGARILFVSLGCPKQEKWMAKSVPEVDLVMLGVGAAFDFYAGDKKIAPLWMRKAGLEWLHRLVSEPTRLWKRYLINNPLFAYLYVKALMARYWSAVRLKP